MKFFFCILSLLGLWHYLQVTDLQALLRGSLAWSEFSARMQLSEMPLPLPVMCIALFVVPPFFFLSCLVANCVRLSRPVRKRLFIAACVAGALFLPLLLRCCPPIPRDICVLLVLWAISLWFERKEPTAMNPPAAEAGGSPRNDGANH